MCMYTIFLHVCDIHVSDRLLYHLQTLLLNVYVRLLVHIKKNTYWLLQKLPKPMLGEC